MIRIKKTTIFSLFLGLSLSLGLLTNISIDNLLVKQAKAEDTSAEIKFGNNGTKIGKALVETKDNQNNPIVITTTGTTSFTQNTTYSQIGSVKAPASLIEIMITLPSNSEVTSFTFNIGGAAASASGNVKVTVGQNEIISDSYSGSSDKTLTYNQSALGDTINIKFTDLVAGVKLYKISYTYGIGKTDIDHIEITTPPNKTTYYEGYPFEKDGMVVTAYYSDLTSQIITTYNVSPNGNLTLDDTEIVVSYLEKTATYPITVNKDDINGLTFVPEKVEFYLGEEFNPNGECTITRESGKEEKVTPTVDSSKVDINVPGTYEIVVNYQDSAYPFTYNVTYKINSKQKFTLVTSVEDLYDGMTFVMASSNEFVNGNYDSSKKYFGMIEGEFSNNDLFLESDYSYTFALVKNDQNWKIKYNDNFIGTKKAGEIIYSTTGTTDTWDISFSSNNVNIASTNSNFGKFFYNASSKIFRTYTSNTMTAIQMYKIASEAKVITPSISSIEGDVNSKHDISLTVRGCEPTSYKWEISDTSVATVKSVTTTEVTNEVTLNKVGNTTLTITAFDNETPLTSCEVSIVCKTITHNVVTPGSNLVINYTLDNHVHALNPIDLTDTMDSELTDAEAFTFDAYPIDECYVLKAGEKYVSSIKTQSGTASQIHLSDTIEDYFLITNENDGYVLQSQVTNKYLQLFLDSKGKYNWYCFDSKQANYCLNFTVPMTFDSLSIVGTPNKVIYNVGEEFDIYPAKVMAHYSGNIDIDVTERVTFEQIKKGDTNAVGKITLSGLQRSVTYPISVTDYQVSSIKVETNKLEYYVGESVKANDVTVTATYVDEEEIGESYEEEVDFTNCTVTPAQFISVGDNVEVSISYQNVSDTYNVKVKAVKFAKAKSITSGDEVTFVCEEKNKEMSSDVPSSIDYDFTPKGDVVFTVEKGNTNESWSFKDKSSGKYLGIDGTKTALLDGKSDLSSWTVNILNDDLDNEAIVTNVEKDTLSLAFNTDNNKFNPTGRLPVYIYKDVSINPPQSISVHTMPNKVTYEVGETFDPTGLEIKVNYGGGAFDIIKTGFMLSTPDMSEEGTKSVTVTYLSLQTSFNITVNKSVVPASLTSISVNANKTTYQVGEAFVKPIVTANYSDGSTKDVSNLCSYSGFDLSKAGSYTVTVSYIEKEITKTATYNITVNSEPTPVATLTSISLTNVKSEYKVNDEFVKPTVTAHYSDGSSRDVSEFATCEGYNLSVYGTYTILVSYTENNVTRNTSYVINVNKDTPAPTQNKGCGGNVITTSVVLSSLALLGTALILIKKKKKN